MSEAIATDSLVKTYEALFGPGQQALRGLTLRVPRGSAFGLIGPNGAGKTTFIKLLLGVVRPTAGSVRVLGGDPEELSVRARIGYLPERLHLPPSFKPLQFLRSVAALKRLRLDEGALRGLLDRVGLGSALQQRLGSYSKGMRQRLGLAGAMLGQPDLLVLDEPTDGIDPVGRVEVRRLLLDEKKRGATLLLNSHLLAETERVCDRVGILDHGRLRLEGTLDEVRLARSRWLVRFAPGAKDEALLTAGFTREDAAWAFAGADEVALGAALDAARRAGALLVELAPATRDLEQVLTETLEARP